MTPHSPKLSAADRRQTILAAAAPVFARFGRAGATTRQIADAAGISEALLYRHFPGKEALYAELERHCVEANEVGGRLLDGAVPSTASLVTGVAVLVQAVFPGIGARQAHDDTKRLLTASLLDDGRFARAFLDRHVTPWIGFFERCLRAAREAGDVEDGVHAGRTELWFVHHLASALHMVALSGGGVVEHGLTEAELTASAVRFLLRGLGLTAAAIDRSYRPKELEAVLARTERE